MSLALPCLRWKTSTKPCMGLAQYEVPISDEAINSVKTADKEQSQKRVRSDIETINTYRQVTQAISNDFSTLKDMASPKVGEVLESIVSEGIFSELQRLKVSETPLNRKVRFFLLSEQRVGSRSSDKRNRSSSPSTESSAKKAPRLSGLLTDRLPLHALVILVGQAHPQTPLGAHLQGTLLQDQDQSLHLAYHIDY
ncbi:hypothetical protein TREMEDRAFT_59720 [Tremella mesenterica DSM 1558]|uniref:uncharacterized protein n=1 Tax=Tremella mesenterica (strain ATCC 24925 / CBS 8224 / DSM 1558 / NBRC 9311 / NRRL Y-6157 / RJB 2259-6 / UBC 559-6) TaxID=578456 RepID=UPI0003F49D0D|nr:uncharacterized protein TREMEDRAFT_59720 [Tremella mesenterica DSM 1558]EIW73544.1 hypothetical protein TREMEDRAFT_59720 [Tremella mesenterica DSM 1558]